MKSTIIALAMAAFFFTSCGGNETKSDDTETTPPVSMLADEPEAINTAEMSDSKGVGPITDLALEELNEELASAGKATYEEKCSVCHKVDEKVVGPSPTGILERRTPEWIMNMMLNPEGMLAEDPVAKQLLAEFNGVPMTNQNLSEDEARSILEYFRTL